MVDKIKRTTMILEEGTRKIMQKFVYIDDYEDRTKWIKGVAKFREELNNIPRFTDKKMSEIIEILKGEE